MESSAPTQKWQPHPRNPDPQQTVKGDCPEEQVRNAENDDSSTRLRNFQQGQLMQTPDGAAMTPMEAVSLTVKWDSDLGTAPDNNSL